ncbi:MAG TPA: sulfite exporter TauE/SafE family protein [Bryobacteraceae bacterium]|nr:sulfite exporter TauE/SafE family protein [Bryobacteraceae bacterium]
MSLLRTVLVLVAASVAFAHPMGNFSVNHYSKLNFHRNGVELTYVLDLAEIPTFQLLGASAIEQDQLERKTREQAKDWVANLALAEDGRKIRWDVKSVTPKTSDGAGGMPILRIVIDAEAPLRAGKVTYDDLNFPGRAGWKEIVIDHSSDAVLRSATQTSQDLSAALTVYPSDPAVTPPQDLTASVEWTPKAAMTASVAAKPAPAIPQPAPAAAPPSSFVAQQPSAPGSVVRGDFLSRMLQRKDLGWRLMLLCALAALGLGAMHAMSPGHGKTIVAAYLVGSRGTLKHAGLLGLVVTFTHTFTVFLLGIGVLFFEQYVVPEKIVPALGMLSGLSIVVVGASLLYRRAQALMAGGHDCHQHDHEHGSGLVHSHGGSTHSHAIERDITPGNLIALGVGGGLVPCPSALILMLSAIALGRPGLGLALLIAFSAGLALVLIGIGVLALYARQLLPDSQKASRHPAMRLIPVFSSVVVIVLGLGITAVSAGWIQPMRFLS